MNAAEALLDVVSSFKRRNGLLIAEGWPDNTVAVVRLSLNLLRRSGLALRAQVEKWDKVRIVREVY